MPPPRILLVDDDEPFRERLAKAFRSHAYLTEVAGTVEDACRLFSTFHPTHAVIDLRIGDDSGLELLPYLTQNTSCRAVLLTGYGSIATAIESVRRGAINYLTKPITFSMLERTLFGEPLAPSSNEDETQSVPSLDEVEWEHIQRVLRDCDGNITHAAAKLSVHRQALQRKLKKVPTKLR